MAGMVEYREQKEQTRFVSTGRTLNVLAKGIQMGVMVADYRQCKRWALPLFGQEGY